MTSEELRKLADDFDRFLAYPIHSRYRDSMRSAADTIDRQAADLREARRLLEKMKQMADTFDVIGDGYGNMAVSSWGHSITVQDCREARAFLARAACVEPSGNETQ